MPKSKRVKIVHLTQTDKKGRAHKDALFQQIREELDTHQHVYIISINNMRNTFLKDIREEWKGKGRIFWGRNKVIAKSLGSNAEDEYLPHSHLISKELSGNVGLFLTDSGPEEVLAYFQEFKRVDYARGGSVASSTVVLPAGKVMRGAEPFPNSMESQLRSLGVPSLLKNGIVTIGAPFTICAEGQVLSHDSARLLKMFDIQSSMFQVQVVAHWNKEGLDSAFTRFDL